MRHLLGPEGEAALAALLQRRPLLGFDFDGTLAPIVAQADEAHIPDAVAQRLQALAALCPVVVVSGRAVSDLRGRLGFVPHHIVGSHGADDPSTDIAAAHAHAAALEPLRAHLRRHAEELAAAGVTIEDKRLSIALHYRRAPDPRRARMLLRRLLEPASAGLAVFAGKRVFNATARGAPDKARAMHRLVRRFGADCALFAGDDVNDEPVFASAPADWLTVRVGRDRRASRARYFIDGPLQKADVLQRALECLRGLRRSEVL
jgi:trehalose 6-phosphate phosphatase